MEPLGITRRCRRGSSDARREKGRRHEYEYVYVDDEGHERRRRASRRSRVAARRRRRSGEAGAGLPTRRRGGRTVAAASWRRVLKRGAIFAPIMFVIVCPARTAALTLPQRSSQTVAARRALRPVQLLDGHACVPACCTRSGSDRAGADATTRLRQRSLAAVMALARPGREQRAGSGRRRRWRDDVPLVRRRRATSVPAPASTTRSPQPSSARALERRRRRRAPSPGGRRAAGRDRGRSAPPARSSSERRTTG